MNIGIIGNGFVGSAIAKGLSNDYRILVYDINKEKSTNTQSEVCEKSDIIFVCLPTPTRKDRTSDTSILIECIKEVDEKCEHSNAIIVIKSTIPPGTSEAIQGLCTNCEVVFSPEFLTEANSFEDFKNQSRILLGGDKFTNYSAAYSVRKMFEKVFPDIPIVVTDWATAEMVKYFTNCFLATKVIFANEMYELCLNAGIDYDSVRQYALYDNRIGKSHLKVPGPDGDRGFGGHCFPKDLIAITKFAEKWFNPSFLQQVKISNDVYRTNKDWENMKGRAFIDE